MGEIAAQVLIKILRDGVDSLHNKRVILSTELKVRESCGIYQQGKLERP